MAFWSEPRQLADLLKVSQKDPAWACLGRPENSSLLLLVSSLALGSSVAETEKLSGIYFEPLGRTYRHISPTTDHCKLSV